LNYTIKPVKPAWRQRPAGIEGVSDIAARPPRVQLNATDEAIEKIRKGLNGDFHVQEIANREPQG
jgi:hypothetical protein